MPEIFIRLDVGFRAHPKTLAFEAALGREQCWRMPDLWAWAAMNRPDGRLRGLSDKEIARHANWRGAVPRYIEALLFVPPGEKRGFAYRDGDTVVLYHWQERQQWFVREEVRAYERLRKRGQREKRPDEGAPPNDVPELSRTGVPELSRTSPGMSRHQSERESTAEEREISPLPPSPVENAKVPEPPVGGGEPPEVQSPGTVPERDAGEASGEGKGAETGNPGSRVIADLRALVNRTPPEKHGRDPRARRPGFVGIREIVPARRPE